MVSYIRDETQREIENHSRGGDPLDRIDGSATVQLHEDDNGGG